MKGAKDPANAGCTLHYRDIGDYLSREDKLRILAPRTWNRSHWEEITPNAEGDWINQRDQRFADIPDHRRERPAARSQGDLRGPLSGLKTGRDSWVYNFSKQRLTENVESMVDFYNGQVASFAKHARAAGIASPTADAAEAFIDYDANEDSVGIVSTSRMSLAGSSTPSTANASTSASYRPFTEAARVSSMRD